MSTPASWTEHARQAIRRKPDYGDGPECPEGNHGRLYSVRRGWWCPVSSALFEATNAGHDVGPVLREGYPR